MGKIVIKKITVIALIFMLVLSHFSFITANTTSEGTTEETSESVITKFDITKEQYKGYLYHQTPIDTEYQEANSIEIANLDELTDITIENEKVVFVTETEEIDAMQMTFFKTTTLNKNNVTEILGETGEINFLDGEDPIMQVTSNTQADENGNIVVEYEAQTISKLKIIISNPSKTGTLEILHTKVIKPTPEYDIEKLKEIVALKETITVNEESEDLQMALLDTYTEAKIEVSKENWSTVIENKEVEISVILKSDSNKNDLYVDPTIKLELPTDIEEINVNHVSKLYGDEFEVTKAYLETKDGKKYINIELVGEQTQYKETTLEGTRLVINANITLNKKATSKTDNIILNFTNKVAKKFVEGQENGILKKEISIVSPKELITIHNIPELGIETVGEEETVSKIVKSGTEPKQINIQSEIINNNEGNITDVSILGDLGTDNEQNNMGITPSGISVEAIDNSKVKVYYTGNQNATENIEDETNGWSETITTTAKKYLVKITSMANSESLKLSYQATMPANIEYNKASSQGYIVKYTNETTGEKGNVKATTIKLETGNGPVVEAKLTAKVGNKTLNANDLIKQGEVINYQVEITNIGTEDANNITIKGQVPEGTVAVEPIILEDNSYHYMYGEYYQEIEKANYEFSTDELKIGESKQFNYEVRVKSDTVIGNKIINNAIIQYNGIEKTSNKLSNTVENGNLRVSVKNKTDIRAGDLNEFEIIGYQAIIENTSKEEQKDITINWDIPEIYEVNSHYIISEDENTLVEECTERYIQIDKILPNEKSVIDIYLVVKKQEGVEKNSIVVRATQGEKTYYSNELLEYINSLTNVEVTLESNKTEQYVKPGDVITYTITAINKNVQKSQIDIYDLIPEDLTVTNVTLNGQIQELNAENNNEIRVAQVSIEPGEKAILQIETVVDTREQGIKTTISNQAYISVAGKEIKSNTVTLNIEYPESQALANLYSIRGKAWIDENSDGELQENESAITGITVYLMNVTTGQIVSDGVITGEDGIYEFNNVAQGKYLVVFDYDTSRYTLTTYEKEGVGENKTSKVISKKLTINNVERNYAVTDIIEIVDQSVGNINIGLVKSKEFDLKLDKKITKVIVQNSKGTSIENYEETSLAKVEIHSKDINNSNVIVEYQLKITNQGEIDGYVKQIVDYLPEGFKFNSELNKDWYQSGNNLYNITLANEKIKPGETKTIILSLIKTMTAETTGTFTNKATIAENYNDLGISDINKENDTSIAEIIITISTGNSATYTIIFFLSIMIIATGVYFIKTKVLNKDE